MRRSAPEVRSLLRAALIAALAAAGLLLGLAVAERYVQLPWRNPWDVTGLLAALRYNPANNLLKYLLVVAGPSLLLLLAAATPLRRLLFAATTKPAALPPETARRRPAAWVVVLSLLYVTIMAICVTTYHAGNRQIDAFHEGETLGAATCHLAGQAPYRDTIFVHGVWQDPLRSATAFALFGRSIGAARTLESLTKVASYLLLFALLWRLGGRRLAHAHAAFLLVILLTETVFLHVAGQLAIPPRDVVSFAFLLLMLELWRRLRVEEATGAGGAAAFAALAAFTAVGAFAYSVDRGFFLTAALLLVAPLLLHMAAGRKAAGRLALAGAAGGLAGVLLLGAALQWQFAAFADFVFVKMPQYKELMDGKVYPFTERDYLIPVAVTAFNAFVVLFGLLRAAVPADGGRLRAVLDHAAARLPAILLLVLSVLFYRSALGRSDPEHVVYASAPTYLLSLHLLVGGPLRGLLQRRSAHIVLATIIVVFALAGAWKIHHRDLLARNFPFRQPDRELVTPEVAEAIDFLKANLAPGDDFFTMTSEAVWYYHLDRPCPCRFPVVWFAMPPFYQQEIVRDLQRRPVKLVLYADDSTGYAIDGITSRERLPIVEEYLRAAFEPFAVVGAHEIWIRRESAP
ncbi:MAG: hypothetical protein IPI34_13385 [bacterium]|nr:hypothetical protein [bacterium]